jgi:hypothetical protein
MNEFKPMQPADIKNYASGGRESRRGLGCIGFGCIGSVVLLLLLCAGSYYAVAHTSLPLSLIKRAIESDGNARVQGLRGSINTGFEIDRLEFRSEYEGKWNELIGIKLAYNGLFDIMRNNRVIISEASVRSAMIYSEYEEPRKSEQELRIPFSWLLDVEPVEFGREFGDLESEDLRELVEMRIGLVNVGAMTLVDPETDDRLAIETFQYRDLLIESGKVTNPGQFTVKCDFFDAETGPSAEWPSVEMAWLVKGELKPAINKILLKPLPFELDLAHPRKDKTSAKWSLMNGALKVDGEGEREVRVLMTDFSPGEYLDLDTQMIPSKWNVSISSVPASEVITEPGEEPAEDSEREKDGPQRIVGSGDSAPFKRTVKFLPGGHFMLGNTRFELEPATFEVFSEDNPPLVLVGNGKLGERDIKAVIRWQESAPFLKFELSSPGLQAREIWALLFYDKPYKELDETTRSLFDKVAAPYQSE